MKLFIDTADIAQITDAWSWGIIDGVASARFLNDWKSIPK
jgi:hypothetical protein